MTPNDLDAYLARIGYGGPVEPSAGVLAELHWAHLQFVPFENLDIRPLHRAIDLNLDALHDKIVRRRRGGFCYELNGLLAEALTAIGYGVTRVSVQFIGENAGSPPFDHMGLLVKPSGDDTVYLADVGCGRNSPARPLPLLDGHEERQAETLTSYRIQRDGEWWELHQQTDGEEWKPIYHFTDVPRAQEDFALRCVELSTLPESHFTHGPLATLATPGGRVTLGGGKVIETRGADRRETELADDSAFHSVLRERFGLDLSLERRVTE